MKTLVIFDIDGTLIYSEKADSQCFADSYHTVFGQPLPTIEWEKYKHVTDHTIFHSVFNEQFGRTVTEEELDTFQTHFVSEMDKARGITPEQFNETPGSRQCVENLFADEKYVVGIATGGWRRPAQFKLNYKGIDFSKTFDSYADNKPTREEILQESIDKAKKQHPDIQRIVYVGDAIWDVRTTRNMQLPLIGIRWKGDFDALREQGASHVLQNFLDYDLFLKYVEEAKTPNLL